MLLRFSLVNLQTGETGVAGYVDAAEVISWNLWNVPDDLGPGVHRSLRRKAIVVINLKAGCAHWCEESFDAVSARILDARGQKDEAEIHRAALAAAAMRASKSLLAV